MKILNIVKTSAATIGGGVGYFVGNVDSLLLALVIFVVADYITGVLCAISKKKLSSNVGFKGISKKICIFIMVGIANVFDVYLIKTGNVIRGATIFFYIANEGISLLENVGKLGLPIPDKIKETLEQIHDKLKNEDEDKKVKKPRTEKCK